MRDGARGEARTGFVFREWLWLAVTLLGLLAAYLSPLREHIAHLSVFQADLRRAGVWAPLVYALGLGLVTAMGMPRLVLYPLGGMAFGFGLGLACNLAGTMMGAYAAFMYARWGGRSLILKKWPQAASLMNVFDAHGVLSVALLRQLPTPGFLTNVVLGLSSLGHGAYLGGTFLGSIPSAIPATLVGSGLLHMTAHTRHLCVAGSIAVLASLWLGFGLYARRSRRFASARAGLASLKNGRLIQ